MLLACLFGCLFVMFQPTSIVLFLILGILEAVILLEIVMSDLSVYFLLFLLLFDGYGSSSSNYSYSQRVDILYNRNNQNIVNSTVDSQFLNINQIYHASSCGGMFCAMLDCLITNAIIISSNFMGKLLTLFLLLFCANLSVCFNFREVVVSSSNYKIRNYATYTFLLSRIADNNFNQTSWNNVSVPAGSNITIQFPAQYPTSNIALCSCPFIIIDAATTNNPAMTISGNTVIISNTITTPSFIQNVEVVLTNIKNPEPAIKTSFFVGTIGIDVAQPALAAFVQLQMGNLPSCSATFSKGFVDTYDNLTISLTSVSVMATDSLIQVTFPTSYQAAAISKSIGVNKTMTCLSNLGISGVYCNANTSNPNVVTVYNAFSANSTAQSTNFQINGILVPPTIQPIDTIKIATYTSAGVGYDQCTVSYSNLNPLVMTALSFITSSTIYVNKIFTTNITIPLLSNLYSSDFILITMPSEYSPAYKLQGLTGFIVSSSATSVTGCIINSNTSVLLNFSTIASINSGSTLLIILSAFIAPPSSGIAPTFTVGLYQAGYIKCTGSVTLTIYPNTITSISTSASNPIIGALSPYSITYLSADPIPSSGMIRILFPPTIAVSSSISQVAINGNSVSFSLLSVFNGLLLTNVPSMAVNSAIKITVNSIKNPSTSDSITSALSLSTYYTTSTADLVASVSYIPIQLSYTGSQTINYLVYSSSDVVAATNVSLLFVVSTQLGISPGGSISIVVFKMVSSIASTSCQLATNNASIVYPCWISNNGSYNIVTISNISSQLGNTFNITIANAFTNPPSTYPQAYFTIITYSQLGTQTERTSPTSSLLTISKPASFISFTISRTSSKNSDKSNYTFSFKQPSAFLTDTTAVNSVKLIFPPEMSLESASCSNCVTNASLNSITVTLDNSFLVNSTVFSVVVNNIINAPSLQPPSRNISAITTLNTIYNYSSANVPDNYLDTINSIPSVIILANSTGFSSMMVGQQNSLTVAILTNNTSPQYYILSLNSQFIGQNISCSISSNYSCIFNSPLHYVLINKTSPSIPFPSTLVFTVAGFVNPVISSFQSLSSYLSGYSASKYLINQYNGSYLVWTANCDFPCQTCSSVNKSLCLSCITNTSLSSFIYYYAVKQVCLSVCYSTQIPIGGQCIDCTNNCMECAGSTSRCTACNTSTAYAYFYNFTCLNATSCPSSYYPDPTYNCLKCQSPCQTCLNTYQCITCAVGAFWLNTNCVSECPYNSTIANSVNKTCDACSPICATCLGSVNNCSTCGSGTVRFNGSCLQNCSASNSYVYIADCVSYCVAPCLTCQVMATYCLSCLTNTSKSLFLYQGQCLTSCPSSFVINLSTHSCDSCSSLNISCSHCSSNNNCSFFGGSSNCSVTQYYSCIKCETNFTYYFNALLGVYQCVASLPDGYVSVNYVATLCDPSCLTCVNFTTNCIYCISLYFFNGQCVSSCLGGYYPTSILVPFNMVNRSTLVCLPCQGNCLTCLNQTQCLSCKNNTYYNGNYSCVASANCPLFTYGNDTYWNCTSCASPCRACHSYSGCDSCLNDFYFYLGACSPSCPAGLFQDNTNNSCSSCNIQCATCQLSSSTCASCATLYYLYSYNNSCLSSCPIGFTINYNLQICQNCTLPCIECAQTACFRCTPVNATVYYIFQNVCVSACPDGNYANNDPLNYSCLICNQTCSTCITASLCITCAAGYSQLSPGICVDQCPTNKPIRKTVNGTSFCLACTDTNCTLCTPTDICLQCRNYTFVLLEGLCSTTCPSNLIKVENITNNSAICAIKPPINETAFIEGQTLVLPISYPCCYVAAGFCCMALFIKFFQFCCMDNDRVLLFPLLSAALAIPQMCATYLAAFTYFLMRFRVFLRGPLSWDVFIYLFTVCIAAQIGIGLYTLIIETRIQWGDSVYGKWSKCANCVQKLYQYSINLLTIFNFKISHCLWCGIKSLPMLQTSNKLVFYNRPSGLSALFSLIITADSILVLYFHPEVAVIYYDIIIVIAVSLLFSLLALRRPYDFFIRHLEVDPSLPLNRRVAQSQNYLIGGLHPIKTFDEDYEYKKIKKSMNSSLMDDSNSSRSSQSSFNPLSSQRSSVRLQNMSIQYSNPRSSDKFSSRIEENDSVISQSQTLGTVSVFVNPAGISSLQNALFPKQSQASQRNLERQSESESQATQHLVQTNMGILDIGEDESYSVQNEDSAVGKEVLPKQLKANYYDLQRCGSAQDYNTQKSEESVYFTIHSSKMRQNSYSRQSPSASQLVPVDMSKYFKQKSVSKPQSFSANILAASFDNDSIGSNLSTAKKSITQLIQQPSRQSVLHSQQQSQQMDKSDSSIYQPQSKLSQRPLKIVLKNQQESSQYAMANNTVRQETIVNAKAMNAIQAKSSCAVNEYIHKTIKRTQNDNNLSIQSLQSSQFQLYSIRKFQKDSLVAQEYSKRSQLSIGSIQNSPIQASISMQRQSEKEQLQDEHIEQSQDVNVSADYSVENANGSFESQLNQGQNDHQAKQLQPKLQELDSFYQQLPSENLSRININGSQDFIDLNLTGKNQNQSMVRSKIHNKRPSKLDSSQMAQADPKQSQSLHSFKQQNSKHTSKLGQQQLNLQGSVLSRELSEQSHSRQSSQKQEQNYTQEQNEQKLSTVKASIHSKLNQNNSKFSQKSSKQHTPSKLAKKSSNPSLLAANESQLNQQQSQHSHHSNIFNQSNLSNIISINNASNVSGLSNSRHSLKRSRNSYGEEVPNESLKMKSSIKVKQGKELLEYNPSECIISEEAQSVQFSEKSQNSQCSAQKYLTSKQEESESPQKNEPEQNEFRIRTKKRKKKQQAKRNEKSKEKVLYVEEKKFKSLRKEAQKLQKQVRINEKLQRTIQAEHDSSLHCSNMIGLNYSKSGSKEKRRESPKKIEQVYLHKPYNVHPPRQ